MLYYGISVFKYTYKKKLRNFKKIFKNRFQTQKLDGFANSLLNTN